VRWLFYVCMSSCLTDCWVNEYASDREVMHQHKIFNGTALFTSVFSLAVDIFAVHICIILVNILTSAY
jgi:hypothetical protein